MKLLLVAVPDSLELPTIDGCLFATVQHTSPHPSAVEVKESLRTIIRNATDHLVNSLTPPPVES